jgi:uncharacterized protein (DUF58 family)
MVAAPKSSAARPAGRLAFGLTRRALLLLLAGTLLFVPAFFVRHFAWAVVAWDVTILLVALFDSRQLPRPEHIQLTRTWITVPALGNTTDVELSVLQGGKQLLFCRLLDNLPAAFLESPDWQPLTAYPGIPAKLRYSLAPRVRGDQATGNLYLRYRSAAGLIERWAVADLPQTVRIYPAVRPIEEQSLFLARTRQVELQLRRQRQRGHGREFESLRDYLEGDDLRDVCWKASARRGTLVSKQHQIERSQPVWLMIDAGRLLQARVGNYTKLDYATTTALAMSQLALVSGDRVGLLAYGRDTQQVLAPARGRTHLRQMMESLALVHGEPSEADHLRATVTLNRLQPRRSLVLWLTDLAETSMRPEIVDGAAQLMRRHLVLLVAIEQRDLKRIAATRPQDAKQMFECAAAQELVHWREVLLARLRERGALTLETYPEDMTASVLNRYLEIKEKSLL